MPVSVVIPTFNDLECLKGCLDALTRQASTDFVVLACVDGSTDGTVEYLGSSTFPFSLRILEHPDRGNHGRAAARNLALPHLTGEFVLFLDADMRLEDDAVEHHVERLAVASGVSVGAVAYSNADTSLWARYLMTSGAGTADDGANVGPLAFHTANSAVRTADLVAVGGFDESMRTYGGEDTELALRLAELGRSFVYNKSARATSEETKPVAVGLAQRREFARLNLPRIVARHPDGPAPFWVDRLHSSRWRDRAMRALMNPVTDSVVDVTLRIPIFAIQRRMLDYQVLRAVWSGYREGSR